jgi:hypothetical protein
LELGESLLHEYFLGLFFCGGDADLERNKAVYTAYNLTLTIYEPLGRNHLRNNAHWSVGFGPLSRVVRMFPWTETADDILFSPASFPKFITERHQGKREVIEFREVESSIFKNRYFPPGKVREHLLEEFVEDVFGSALPVLLQHTLPITQDEASPAAPRAGKAITRRFRFGHLITDREGRLLSIGH